jgi:hypothetical protein
MHGPINFKSPNNISKWQMRFNSAFKGLIQSTLSYTILLRSYILSLAVSSEDFPLGFYTELASFYTFGIIIHHYLRILGYKLIVRFTDHIVTNTTSEQINKLIHS